MGRLPVSRDEATVKAALGVMSAPWFGIIIVFRWLHPPKLSCRIRDFTMRFIEAKFDQMTDLARIPRCHDEALVPGHLAIGIDPYVHVRIMERRILVLRRVIVFWQHQSGNDAERGPGIDEPTVERPANTLEVRSRHDVRDDLGILPQLFGHVVLRERYCGARRPALG